MSLQQGPSLEDPRSSSILSRNSQTTLSGNPANLDVPSTTANDHTSANGFQREDSTEEDERTISELLAYHKTRRSRKHTKRASKGAYRTVATATRNKAFRQVVCTPS
ncbi:hypothetical protein VNI00_016433 [Paramarasmius palmivorus]|uniref:Uncharacterized protein n=1 Tax=Paramarasmius palmivorus TaxID=297713 RepID=A0AAW0BDM3_9AGAR